MLNPVALNCRRSLVGFVVFAALFSASATWGNEDATAIKAHKYWARTWQTDDGLPRNTITALAQTPDGYLWLGTLYGVVRFDGVNFTAIESEIFPTQSRTRTRVLFTDSRGRLWIGTGTSGIYRYDQGAFVAIDSRNGLPHPSISTICEDADGKIWVASQDGSIAWIDSTDRVHPILPIRGKLTPVAIQLVKDTRGIVWFAQRNVYGQLKADAPINVVQKNSDFVVLCPSRDGGMWVSAGNEIQKLSPDEGNGVVESIASPIKAQLLLEDRDGTLWLGSQQDGVFRLSGRKFTRELETSHRISSLYQDSESNIWVSTEGGGINRLRPEMFQQVSMRGDASPSFVSSVCETEAGNMWFSSLGRTFVRRTSDGKPDQILSLTNISSTCVLPNPDGGVWVGTVDWGLFSIHDGQKTRLSGEDALRNAQIRVLHKDNGGQLWIGCLPAGLANYSEGKFTALTKYFDQGLPRQAIWAIENDAAGHLWLGTIRGELLRYDGNAFETFGRTNGLPGSPISALHMTAEGDLWIGTLGGGIGRMKDGRFSFADVRHGLADNAVSSIVEDGLGYFWFGSERGIFRVKRSDLDAFADGKITHFESFRYGKDDGLANVECNGGYQPSAWRTKSGDIWFATSKGAIVVNPASIQTKPPPDSLLIASIVVDDNETTNRTDIKLAHDYRKIKIAYTSPTFSSPEQVHFRHQLVGFDSDWVAAGTARSVTYPRLTPGSYEFRFTACNSDGVWADPPLSQRFVVTPAFWQTIWFKTFSVLAFTGIVFAMVRFRYVQKMRHKLFIIEQSRAVEQERMRIARDIHDDLGARLTQMALISDMVASELGTNSQTSEKLEQIATGSRLAIRSLEEIVWAVNPRKDSLADFLDFLGHYANEFFRATDIRCRQDVPLLIPDTPLSAETRHHLFLACKEALNNVFKHADAKEVWLRISVTDAELELAIEDDGLGFRAEDHDASGNGLLNLQTRLSAIGGTCQVNSQPGKGTVVLLCLKLSESTPNKSQP